MHRMISYWAVATLLLCAAYVAYVRTLPPDDLVMANTWSFQILVSLLVVGGPSLLALFLFLFFGSIWRSLRSNRAPHTDAREAAPFESQSQARAGGRER